MMKKTLNILAWTILILVQKNSIGLADQATTHNVVGNAVQTPVTSTISVTTSPGLKFEVSSAKFGTIHSQLTISIAVDSSSAGITPGVPSDQLFHDRTVGATYFGYYLSTGVRSTNQPTNNIQIKLRHGLDETPGRTYYLIGNGSVFPSRENDLTRAPSDFTTFAFVPSNSVHCGSHFEINGLSENLHCENGTTMNQMDVTQFVKIIDWDRKGTVITSQLEFIAVAE